MVGFLLVTHEAIGVELIKAVEVIAGKKPLIDSIEFYQNDSLDKLRTEVEKKVSALDQGEGVIIFTDLFGGSCTNISYELKEKKEHKIRIITGVSLNMLLDAVFERDKGLDISKLAEVIFRNSRKATVVI